MICLIREFVNVLFFGSLLLQFSFSSVLFFFSSLFLQFSSSSVSRIKYDVPWSFFQLCLSHLLLFSFFFCCFFVVLVACFFFYVDFFISSSYDVASYDPTTQKFTTLGCAGETGACTVLTAGKICFKTTTAGQFFPIKRKSGELTTGTTTCTGSNVANVLSGLCVAGDISRCMCGFYGAKCESGCPNGCSGAGTCSTFNKCACNKNRKGSDCSLADCPKDATGFYCSQRGKCGTDAKCTCDTGYKGTACAEKVLKDKEQADGGLGEAGKARGINGMRIGGRNDGGRWNSTIVAIFIIGMIILFLCCCCVGVYCCFQQRARSKLRSQTKAVTSSPAKAVEMAYINPNSNVVVQAVPAQGEEVATL